jgi:hypothetical protein
MKKVPHWAKMATLRKSLMGSFRVYAKLTDIIMRLDVFAKKGFLGWRGHQCVEYGGGYVEILVNRAVGEFYFQYGGAGGVADSA